MNLLNIVKSSTSERKVLPVWSYDLKVTSRTSFDGFWDNEDWRPKRNLNFMRFKKKKKKKEIKEIKPVLIELVKQ